MMWRRVGTTLLISLFVSHVSAADTNGVPDIEKSLRLDDTSLLTESMLWNEQTVIRAGVGYKDNVLLSAFHPHWSAFYTAGLDFMLIRAPLDGWQIVVAVTGDDVRYLKKVGTDSEDAVVSSVRVRRDLGAGSQAGIEARNLYENQVLDVSIFPRGPQTALVEGDGISARPFLRKEFESGWWLQAEGAITRWFFELPLDDYWEIGPVATIGYTFRGGSDITASYVGAEESHDRWLALDQYGRLLPDRRKLDIWQDRAELAWHQYWDSARHWRSSTRLVFSSRDDNGGHYFNYDEYQVAQELRWQTRDWQLKGSVLAAQQDYPVQGIGISNGVKLNRTVLEWGFYAERRIYKNLRVFGKMQYQEADSNKASSKYNGTTMLGGLSYEF